MYGQDNQLSADGNSDGNVEAVQSPGELRRSQYQVVTDARRARLRRRQPKPEKRIKVEPCIYRRRYGFEAIVGVGGKSFSRFFSSETHIDVIRNWIDKTRKEHAPRIPSRSDRTFPKSPNGWCYLYVISNGQAYKIGKTTDPWERLRTLQAASPCKIRLLCAVPAHASLEPAIHKHFADSRLEGEWFAVSPELDAFVRACQSGLNPVAVLWGEILGSKTWIDVEPSLE